MAFVIGFLLGVAASVCFTCFSGWSPLWSDADPRIEVLFLPGIWAGEQVYDVLKTDSLLCLAIGYVTMGCIVGATSEATFALVRLVQPRGPQRPSQMPPA